MQIFRETWGFDGFVVSDCGACGDGAFTNYINSQHSANQSSYQILQALSAGTDLNCGSYYAKHIPSAVASGIVSEDLVDRALERVFTAAIELGNWDNTSSPLTKLGPADVDTPTARQLALEAAQQGIILAKNNGNLLPLSKSTKLAVLGPHFNVTQVGCVAVLGFCDVAGFFSFAFHSPIRRLARQPSRTCCPSTVVPTRW